MKDVYSKSVVRRLLKQAPDKLYGHIKQLEDEMVILRSALDQAEVIIDKSSPEDFRISMRRDDFWEYMVRHGLLKGNEQ